MPPATNDKSSIIRFWHSVELLAPQAVPKTTKRYTPNSALVHELSRVGAGVLVLPWTPQSRVAKLPIAKGWRWSHQVFGHCFDYRMIVGLLEEAFGADNGYRETRETTVGLFALRFTDQGELVTDSFVLSSAAWLAGRICEGKGWLTGFEEAQGAAAEIAAEILDGLVTSEKLEQLTDKLLDTLGLKDFFAATPRRYVCNSVPRKASGTEATDDPLNSFILEDLAQIASSVAAGTTSAPLEKYLSIHDGKRRIDLSDDETSTVQRSLLTPELYPDGCWPTPGDMGLVHSQQLAVNAIHRSLKSQGLLSVNGPPGTGKTTLLRDIVAAVVTTRADALATLATPADAFAKTRGTVVDGDKNRGYWSLAPSLLGHEIVVSSSNNGAIENVTLELPQRDKVDASWLDEYDQYSDIASLVTGQPAWGLISAPLGSKSRRSAFVDAFWSGGARKKGSAPEAAQDADPASDVPDDEVNPAEADAVRDLVDPSPGATAAELEEQPPVQGMEAWLNSQSSYSSAEKAHIWRQAVERYSAAKAAAAKISEDARRISDLLEQRKTTAGRIGELENAVDATAVVVLEKELVARTDAARSAEAQLESAVRTMSELLKRRPGFFANLFSLWAAGRRWAAEEANARAQRELDQGRCQRIEREIQQLLANIQAQRRTYAEAIAAVEEAKARCMHLTEEMKALAERHGAAHLKVYLETDVIGRGDAIELAEPWNISGWRNARSKVFLEALRLHQTLFQLEPKKVWTNLSLAKAVLEGVRYQNMPRDAVRSVWGTLFMAVPVVSSTFASFARCFSTLGAGDIGWLLVDEAGQASPQAAVGALWRSRRAVMVGDPLQLEPINQVPPAALERMRSTFGVDPHWLPQQLSAQRLADLANPIGRDLGPEGDKVWVGMPLVVHRRCDSPMFHLANRIAYDGAMVYGTAARVSDTPATLPTGWVDVRGPSLDNWVPSEGEALDRLLRLLTLEGVPSKGISVITPFSGVIQELGKRGTSKAVATSGTIHTMQGKESDVVIMVLGGKADPQQPGARDWVVEKPNMLNVAATRAKRRFYVIGDRASWSKRKYFKQVMDLLPEVNVEAALARHKDAEEEGEQWWSTQELLDQLGIENPALDAPGTSGAE